MLKLVGFAVATAVGLWVLWQFLLRGLGLMIARSFIANRPRVQPILFVHKLREFVFKNPIAARQILLSESSNSVVRKIWEDSKPPPQQRVGEPSLPADGLSVHPFELSDGRTMVVIAMPPPQRKHEPYLAAVVFPSNALFESDPIRARAITRFFILDRGSTQTGRETDLRGYTAGGDERWYNIGAPTDPNHFAKALIEKLNELKL